MTRRVAARGCSPKHVGLQPLARGLQPLSACVSWRCEGPTLTLTLTLTLTRAKGLGFAHVYLAGDFLGRGQTPVEMARERSMEALRDGR